MQYLLNLNTIIGCLIFLNNSSLWSSYIFWVTIDIIMDINSVYIIVRLDSQIFGYIQLSLDISVEFVTNYPFYINPL